MHSEQLPATLCNTTQILSPSSSLLLLAKTITHPAWRSLCDSWVFCYLSANKVVFYCYWNTVCSETARCYNGKITKEDDVVIKTRRLGKSWSSRRPMKEFPQNEWSRISLSSSKMMLAVRLIVILVSRIRQNEWQHRYGAVRTTKLSVIIYVTLPIIVQFNYVKFAAQHLLLTAAHVCQKLSELVKWFQT